MPRQTKSEKKAAKRQRTAAYVANQALARVGDAYGRSLATDALEGVRALNTELRRWSAPPTHLSMNDADSQNRLDRMWAEMQNLVVQQSFALPTRIEVRGSQFMGVDLASLEPYVAQVESTTTANSANATGLTIEMIQRARRLMDENAVDFPERQVTAIELLMQRYHNDAELNRARHAFDERYRVAAYGAGGGSKPHVKSISPMTWFKHKSIEHNGWTATLLETVEQIEAEGVNMAHCLGSVYTKRIADHKYLAYHLAAPEGSRFPKSGFTLGMFVMKDEAHYAYRYDQLKGKKNSTHYCFEPELLEFVAHIDGLINELMPEITNFETKTISLRPYQNDAIDALRYAMLGA